MERTSWVGSWEGGAGAGAGIAVRAEVVLDVTVAVAKGDDTNVVGAGTGG